MAESQAQFDPFQAALMVRDLVARCECCLDADESQEHYDAAQDLLEWVVQIRDRQVAMEAAPSAPAAARKGPLTNAEKCRNRRERRKAERRQMGDRRAQHSDTVATPSDTAATPAVVSHGVAGSPSTILSASPSEIPAPSKISQKDGESETRAGERGATSSDTASDTERHRSDTGRGVAKALPEAHADERRWCVLLTAFERIVHNGAPSVPHALARLHLTNLLPALDARAKGKPVEYFEAVLRPYDAMKRTKGKLPELEYFCRDFATWADKPREPPAAVHRTMSEPVELDEATRKRRDLEAKLRDERVLLAAANEAARPRLQENVERLQRELEQLTTRAA